MLKTYKVKVNINSLKYSNDWPEVYILTHAMYYKLREYLKYKPLINFKIYRKWDLNPNFDKEGIEFFFNNTTEFDDFWNEILENVVVNSRSVNKYVTN